MAQRPSPDKELIRQILNDRQRNNINDPIPDHESSLLVNSPGHDKSVGRMNQSFSRTKIAASLPNSDKCLMDDAKKQLFAEKEDEEEFLISKHHTLLQQLSEQQHELKRLENKQKELVQLKLQAEARLAAANETVSQTLQTRTMSSNENTPSKMHSKYNLREIPHQIERVQEGSLVEYEESDNEDEEEKEPLTLDSFQFDVLQKKLADLNKRQKDLEQKSLNNQNLANNSFKQINLSADEEKEEDFEETGHASKADYEELCSKVEQLRERKQYMDQLLSYYNLLKDNNNEAQNIISENDALGQSRARFGEPSERDAALMERINNFKPAAQKPEVEEINTPGAAESMAEMEEDELRMQQQLELLKDLKKKQLLEEQITLQKESEQRKMNDIQVMRDQLSRIQQEMGNISFTDNDSPEDITSKLAGLTATRNRVKELRNRLSLFEESLKDDLLA